VNLVLGMYISMQSSKVDICWLTTNAFSRIHLSPMGPFTSRCLQALSAHFAVATHTFDYIVVHIIYLKFINDTGNTLID